MTNVIIRCAACGHLARGIDVKQARNRLNSHRARVHGALRDALDRTGLTAPRTFRGALSRELRPA